ncbi:MAG: hypothetical protein WA192_14525 [Candidatus Acidiferrales bacterium]
MATPVHRSPRASLLIAISLAAALLLAASFVPNASGNAKPKALLEEFYVVTQAVFHGDPKWVDHILDVRPQGADVLVREIRIAPLGAACPRRVTVRAIERVLPAITVKKVAGKFDLCDYAEDDVEAIVHTATRRGDAGSGDEDASASQTVVARCNGRLRMFELPDQESLRFEAIGLADPRLATFWELAAVMEGRAFGYDFSLAKVTPAQDRELQALGAKVVAEIKSGRYDQGFADESCPYAECADHNAASALQGYAGLIFSCPEK